jgi:hypothetical protein
MEESNIFKEYESLPPEARKMVGEFVSFLKDRYPKALPSRKTKRRKLMEEPFIGMWKDREDFQDSTGWVRGFRAREWGRGK